VLRVSEHNVLSAPVQIYSIAVCPFAQRTRILLKLKNIEFALTEIDITRPRPDWFLRLNPLGQVPVIRYQDRVLNESSVINEYLDEVFPKPSVMPEDAYERAQSRILIDRLNQHFVPTMYRLLMNQDAGGKQALVDKALAEWAWLDRFLVQHNPDGVWLWNNFGMADLSAAPFFQRWCLNAYYRGLDAPADENTARVRRWYDACLAHPLVVATGMPDEDYIKLYEDYALGYGNGAVPPGRDRSSFDLSVPLAGRPMPPRGDRWHAWAS
jgi:glutathione S-transferase